jgi:3'-phosphoadenosine 5'-phosphosulfate sulfotransferase (PAPS reductase)/FAD synthetase
MYLAHASLASFRRRVDTVKSRIQQFLDSADRPYAAWSGGKDSECLLILLSEMGCHIPVFTQGDDLDWPDKEAFCRALTAQLGFADYAYMMSGTSALDQFSGLTLNGTKTIRGTFSHVVQRYVYERSRNGVLMGLRSEESVHRRALRASRGWMYRTTSGETRCIPIADWAGIDVFALIVSHGLPYMHVYDCDAFCPPHEIRFSWIVNPHFLHRGHPAWLKHYYPDQFTRLAAINPNLRNFS